MINANDQLSRYDQSLAEQATLAERQRQSAVYQSPECRGRYAAATKLLAGSDMSAESIIGVLAEMPTTDAPKNALERALFEARSKPFDGSQSPS